MALYYNLTDTCTYQTHTEQCTVWFSTIWNKKWMERTFWHQTSTKQHGHSHVGHIL